MSAGDRAGFNSSFTVQPCGSCPKEWKVARLYPLLSLKKSHPAVLLRYQATVEVMVKGGEIVEGNAVFPFCSV